MSQPHQHTSDQQDTSPTELPTPIGIRDYDAQLAWEGYMVQRGIEAYRASLSKFDENGRLVNKALVDTEPGQVIAREMMVPLTALIQEEQQAALLRFNGEDGQRGTKPQTDIYIMCLEAEKMAAITVLSTLSGIISISGIEPTFTKLALELGGRIRDEYNLEQWRIRENQAAKERKERGDEPYPNLVRLMEKRNKVVDSRVMKKWAKKAPLFTDSGWPQSDRIRIGALLLSMLVEANGFFEITLRTGNGGEPTRYLSLTELGKAFVDDRHKHNESMCPQRLPMICEPLDFAYSLETPCEQQSAN